MKMPPDSRAIRMGRQGILLPSFEFRNILRIYAPVYFYGKLRIGVIPRLDKTCPLGNSGNRRIERADYFYHQVLCKSESSYLGHPYGHTMDHFCHSSGVHPYP